MSRVDRQTVESRLREAMKARDSIGVETLRMLLAAIKDRQIELGREVAEEEVLALAQKGIKQRREAAATFRKGDRAELADREEAQISVLETFLPEPVGDEELRTAIAEFIQQQELSGPAAMGRVMKEMMSRYAGRAEGSRISALARQLLSS